MNSVFFVIVVAADATSRLFNTNIYIDRVWEITGVNISIDPIKIFFISNQKIK